MADIKSVNELLRMKLDVPSYQRAYKWDIRNIQDLLDDITNAIADSVRYKNGFKYRVGTIILHKKEDNTYNIVDGQQRIISFVLLKKCLDSGFNCSILNKSFSNKITQSNIHNNYTFIREWFSLKNNSDNGGALKQEIERALDSVLEVVVITVDNITEAFQLFDSQNARGKALDPHDLLKAYHLRSMQDYPYEMEHAVRKWEDKNSESIRNLFSLYLFPIWNWARGVKSKEFTAKEIDTYKGLDETSRYTFARRASRAMPYFQITEPFISGNDFFEMVDHYMILLNDVKVEILNNAEFADIKNIICCGKNIDTVDELDNVKYTSAGFKYVKNLFFCALLYYYDKFHNFEPMAVKKLFLWAFMLRVDLRMLGFDSINKYAIGSNMNSLYSNRLAMFSIISSARLHTEISRLQICVRYNNSNENWKALYQKLSNIIN